MLKVSGAATATSAISQSEARNMRVNVRKQARHGATKDKVTRAGTLGGYEVTGWRYPEDSSWHIKVWRAGRPNEWIGYTVTAGIFELGTGDQAHKEAALHMICEWEGNN
jgi:hypothetical protein